MRGFARRSGLLLLALVLIGADEGPVEAPSAPAPTPDASSTPEVPLAPAKPTARTDTEVARRAHGMFAELMSPYCPGRTLADCPSPNAAALREEVRTLLAQGVSEAQIRTTLSAQFGDAIVGTPRSALGWAIPGLVLAGGAALLVVALRRLSRGREEPVPATDPALEAELEAELRRRGL